MSSCFAMVGVVENNQYSPSSKIYNVPVPINETFGGKINDNVNGVVFTDDFCNLFRIEFLSLSSQETAYLNEIGKEKFLQEYIKKIYMPMTILADIPDASIDYQEYVENIFGGALYVEVNLPKGSTCSVSHGGSSYVKEDTKRGIVIFFHNNNIFFVSTGLEGLKEKVKEITKDLLKDNTVSFSKTIRFK